MLFPATYKHLPKITFPVFVLPSDELTYRDGLLTYNDLIIDDKNMPGDTLGKRRLQSPHKLRQLRQSCFSIADMLKRGKLNFIDTKGIPFRYRKTKFTPLKSYKISKVELKETHSLLWVIGVETPFFIPRPPPPGKSWVRILHLNNAPWQIYGYSTTKLPASRKKI